MFRRHLPTLLIAGGLLLLAWPVVTWGYGRYWQGKLAHAWGPGLGAGRPRPPAASTRDASAVSVAELPFARLQIARIGLDVMVVEGVDDVSLRRGPGHLPDTGRPGESRNCAIAGHRDGWFRRLEEVRRGDSVWVDTPLCAYEYRVDEKRVVDPDRSDLLATGEYPTLTLITCTGPGYPRSSQRLLVFCRLETVLAH